LAAAVFGKTPYLFSLDFDTDSLGLESQAGLPAFATFGDLHSSSGVANFGNSGYLQLEAFPHPTGPFTIEARLRPRDYAPLSTRFISDLANTATWDDGPYQGITFRIGGGYLYPVLPKDAYAASSLYDQSVTGYDNTARAGLSRCLGELAIATKGGSAPWIEVFTDRCIDLDRWTHFVAVWDGENARLYLNGLEATDPWRRNGVGSQPALDSAALLTIGARYGGAFDQRHFQGSLDFVRMLDTAMSEGQIRLRYRESMGADTGANPCKPRIVPVSPQAGELCDSGCAFRCKVTMPSTCPDFSLDGKLRPGDSLEVEFSAEPDFVNPFLQTKVGQADFRIGKESREKAAEFKGPCYWRARLIPKAVLAKRSAETSAPQWSEPKPFLLDYQNPMAVHRVRAGMQSRLKAVAGGYLLENLAGMAAPTLYRADGRRVAIGHPRGSGAWFIPNIGEHGIFLVKTTRGIFRVAL
jgi:hypothetical protein